MELKEQPGTIVGNFCFKGIRGSKELYFSISIFLIPCFKSKHINSLRE